MNAGTGGGGVGCQSHVALKCGAGNRVCGATRGPATSAAPPALICSVQLPCSLCDVASTDSPFCLFVYCYYP